MQKVAVHEAILAALRAEFQSYLDTSKKARSTGNDAQTKAEGKYDTRSIEENYLADGMARHALVSRQALDAIAALGITDQSNSIRLGSLVEVAFTTENAWFYLAPAAGGLEVTVRKQTITVLTPESPLGRQLISKSIGQNTMQPESKILTIL